MTGVADWLAVYGILYSVRIVIKTQKGSGKPANHHLRWEGTQVLNHDNIEYSVGNRAFEARYRMEVFHTWYGMGR